VEDQEFEKARELKYLGATLTEHNDISIEIEQRTVVANPARYGLRKQLSSWYLGRQTKCALYKKLVRPVL
jgi:hypothetical protein